MRRRRVRRVILPLALAACLPAAGLAAAPPAAPASAGAGLEGRWRLVEQYRGDGLANLAGDDTPLWLEFAREGPGLVCRIVIGGASPRVLAWPAPPADAAGGPVMLAERRIDAAAGRAVARYSYRRGAAAGETLSVIEEYALSEDGASLIGAVTVSLAQDGEDLGRYVLRRRFARAP